MKTILRNASATPKAGGPRGWKRTAASALAAAMLATVAASGWAAPDGGAGLHPALTAHPELEYLKTVNRAGPAGDPQLIFLLSGQFANANCHAEGIAFFEGLLKDFGPRLTPPQRALYLTALASLRAGHAARVPLLSRMSWVKDTVAMLDEAKQLTGGRVFVVRWMSGVVRAQLPGILNERGAALEDLTWCEQHASDAPHAGWLREVYFHLGALRKAQGEKEQADRYLALSGLAGWDKPITFTTASTEDSRLGHAFSPREIREAVPGRVYVLSGFEFTEYYFIVSDDGRELIAIDAGTRPDSAKEAYAALRRHAPRLPPLTTVFVTHAHWDHVGGHRYFRSLNPAVKFYGRENFAHEMRKETSAPSTLLPRFFGEAFDIDNLLAYKPDVAVDRATEVRIGGTRIELLPVSGGETDDALLVHLPDHGVMFAGDVAMPYLGAPFAEEGDLQGLLATIDVIAARHPRILLHGHEPLTRLFPSAAMLTELRVQLAWLNDRVLEAVRRGEERAVIQQSNLTPPGIAQSSAQTQMAFLVLRENVINRLYDQNIGYWQPDLQGMDATTLADRGALLTRYLDLSEDQILRAAERLTADGRHEMAAGLMQWVQSARPLSPQEERAKRLAYLKLVEKYQEFSPFKMIIYADRAGLAVPPIPNPAPSVAH